MQALYTVFFPTSVMILVGKVQGFCGETAKNLALEQRKIVLKALACKDDCVVQYTLYMWFKFICIFEYTTQLDPPDSSLNRVFFCIGGACEKII